LFTLHVNPYYLRLNFSHNLLEDDESSAKYDGTSGYLTITLTKEIPGQEFKDLDLLAKLLAPKKTEVAPNIEVVGQENNDVEDETTAITAGVENLGLEDSELLEGEYVSVLNLYHYISYFRQRPKMTGKSNKKYPSLYRL
jgi:protein SHQ1